MMWICILQESFLRRRLCLVVCMALAVITLIEAPPAKAQDIVRDVNQARNLELYYAAVTTVIPKAVTSVLKEQFELPHHEEDDETKKREKSHKVGKKRPVQQTTNSTVDSDDGVNMVNGPSEVNERTNLNEVELRTIYSKDEEVSNTEATKERTNTHDHGKRTTNKSNRQLITLDVMQQDADVTKRTLPLEFMKPISGEPDNTNVADNYIFDEETDDELDHEDEEEYVIDRIRKDTSNMDGVTWESLQRLAEFATASNPDLRLINLVTPNPDIEITIEVLPDIGADEGDPSLTGVLANEVTHTKSPGRKGKGKKGKGKKKKNRDRTKTHNNNKHNTNSEETNPVPNIPSRKGDTNEEEETNKPVDNGEEESSYSYPIGGPLLPFIPDDFEHFNFEEDIYPIEEGGEWTDWSRCTASCGGGRTERSRSCGFSCTATETQDCNQHPCPEIEYLDSQVIAGFQPVLETSSPTVQTTDELFRYLDPSLTDFVTDSCEEWMSCKSETLMSYLSRLEDLPSCPCFYPTSLRVNDMLWDKVHRKMFRWMVSDNEKERLDVYKSSAKYCIRSLLTAHSTSLAAQQCCYDEAMRLVTRGPGAGTPKLISREISLELNYKIDILPWIICKGDWSKYNTIRQPNNGRGCREFPADDIYMEYLEELNDF